MQTVPDRTTPEFADQLSNPDHHFSEPFLGSATQIAGIRLLSRAWQRLHSQTVVAGVNLRTHKLMIGETGCGKTEVVKRFCETLNLEPLSIACNSWNPDGASSTPHTLDLVRDYVDSNSCGVIFLDELDKAVPQGGEYSTSWAAGIFGEILALLDAGERLETAAWPKPLIYKLRESFLCVGAGAFQSLANQVQHAKPSIGFAQDQLSAMPHYGKSLHSAGLMPREILTRFNSEWIFIDYPTVGEFQRAIEQVRIELFLGALPKEKLLVLAEQAFISRTGMRWVEAYVNECLDEVELETKPGDHVELPVNLKTRRTLSLAQEQEHMRALMARFEDIYPRLLDVLFRLKAVESILAQHENPALWTAVFGDQNNPEPLVETLPQLREVFLRYPFASKNDRLYLENTQSLVLAPIIRELGHLLINCMKDVNSAELYHPLKDLHWRLEIYEQQYQFMTRPKIEKEELVQ